RRWDLPAAVDLTVSECLRERRGVSDKREVNNVNLCRASVVPIVLVLHDLQGLSRVPVSQSERAGTHQPAFRGAQCLASSFTKSTLHYGAASPGERWDENCIGGSEVDRYRSVRNRLHTLDGLKRRCHEGVRASGIVEAEYDVIHCYGGAVPERRVAAQGKDGACG